MSAEATSSLFATGTSLIGGDMQRRSSLDGLVVALAAFGFLGCDGATVLTEVSGRSAPSLAVTGFVITGVRGTGGMGPGSPTVFGIERQWFDVDVTIAGVAPSGRMEFIDSSFVKEDGNHPHLVVGPGYAGTAFTSFVPTSAECARFQGVGRLLNTDELLVFDVETCDNAQPGVGFDTFGITVPQRILDVGTFYSAGPFPLVYGELTASGMTPVQLPGLP